MPLQLVKLAVLGPVNFLTASAQYVWEAARLCWSTVAALGAAAVSGWRAMTAGVRVAPALQQGAQGLGRQVLLEFSPLLGPCGYGQLDLYLAASAVCKGA